MKKRPSSFSGLRRSSGYTLVELLLALTLMGMLLALAYGGLRASTRAADKGQAILEDSGSIRMEHQFVRKQLNQMLPLVFAENEDQTEQQVFAGAPYSIRFVAPMPGYLGFGGPQVQELSLVPNVQGHALVLNHALLQGFEEQNLYERQPIVLLDNIATGTFSFLGRDEEGNLTNWMTSWTETDILPEAVSLDIEFSEEVYIQWPLLTASVRTDPSAVGQRSQLIPSEGKYSDAIRDMINKRKNKQ